ncbi:DEAD/DEAH box helicase [Parathalassolituus penaei]|uniref:DEAD/DEAH box helicase n=1 Tax=Parathalassolituus penaei TaxID=2997323 RepID=A0A9X3ISF2_9GAMM|nr:DEAD/DEAH box helicase [Parathalassolituus penaei]MCY0964088.1 DEAD/DEAH box helicase [Parathalassolituus penaei]
MFTEISLNPRLLLGLEKLAISEPTEVQSAVLPLALAGKDVQVCAETGSGKTLAYLLPLLTRLLDNEARPNSGTRALILLPTRELANQVHKVCKLFSEFVRPDSGLICGGEEFRYQASLLRKNPEIVIATPGRLVDHLKRGTCDLKSLEFLVLDEADRMLDMGFAEDMDIIISACNTERQTMMLSATLRHEGVGRVARKMLKEPAEITTRAIEEQHDLIVQQRILADDPAHKDRLLVWLLANETFEKAIVFANKRSEVERLSEFVRRHREGVAMLHGEMSQDDRRYVMQMVREGRRPILIATDVAARGLDVEGMDLVINYDLARKADEYVHRIGRTGRAGKAGLAISLIMPYEWNLKASIERTLQMMMQPRQIDGLVAAYKGPKKLKSSGKAAGTKKKKDSKKDGAKKDARKKSSEPRRVGKGPATPKPAKRTNLMDGAGFAPVRRQKREPDAE